ncbi:hypothetical protein CGZ96_13035 [Enemella evansiae]|uniref:hypothetical protein n=1 Tax=Enemella evansiae TaxID=2016499 RepID=UPI000B9697DF|nr:hypothetical protein [Enemella evansiae]OYN96194.1 hypothetical protein CGZ96_13035 [Enemella evansiae]
MSDDPKRTSGDAEETVTPVGRRSWGPDEDSTDDDRPERPAHRAARAADDESEQAATDQTKDSVTQTSADQQGTDEPGAGEDPKPSTDPDRPAAKDVTDTSGDKPTDEPTERAADKPADRGTEKPAERATDKAAAEKPGAEKPGAKAADERPTAPRPSGQQSAPAPKPTRPQSAPAPRPQSQAPQGRTPDQPRTETERPRSQPGQPGQSGERYSAGELIAQLTPASPPKARTGWRARFGLAPTQRELDENRDTEVAKTVFTRPVTIMVANPKGGAGKTPTALLLAAAFGLARGGGVVAWDNNELRGTMPDRSASPHRRNVRDLLESMERLQRSDAQFTDLAHFLNHQASGTFYTLGSAQTSERVISDQDFREVHDVFARFFQVIVTDTGNNEAAPNWVAAAEVADCLVVPTKWRSDSLIPAARMLETLQDAHPELLKRTVIAATNGPADTQTKVKANGASWFGSSHPIVEIPTDPHLAEGGVIDYAQLKPATRRAALQLAAEVARRLSASDRD